MEKIIVFLLSILLSLSPVFSGAGYNEGEVNAAAFLPGDGAAIYISFEHYKMQDGWTPVVLSMGEINCLLWMDKTRKVLEMREPGAPSVEPFCFIDVVTQSLRKEADVLYFDVYEQNNIRTRWRLPSAKIAGTMTKKILFREKRGVDLCLGTLRLTLKHAAWEIKEFSPGLYHVQFHGPTIAMHQSLVYEKAAGIIYAKHEWDNKLILEQNRNQAAKPGALTAAAIPSQERAALIALYNSTNGDNWNNKKGWKTPPLAGDGFALPGTEKNWYGITCDPGNTRVQRIYLVQNNLDGSIPPELGNMANLRDLYLSGNPLSGSIPPELGNLGNLQILFLSSNRLSGSLPPELGNMANLQVLYLPSNRLSGSIPPELGNMANLKSLLLYSNQFSGSLPPELGNLAKLDFFDVAHNQFSGSIPPELGNLANLGFLYLCYNQLSGSLPPELGNLDKLQFLCLSSNRLSGALPPELGNMANLQELWLQWNQISGSIPPELGNLANLGCLYLFYNQLSGSIPRELGNLANLQALYLSSNRLSGTLPPELGNLGKLDSFDLAYNHFSGSIPPELGNLANLKWLCLESNRLSGSIPANLMNLRELNDNTSDFRWNALYTNDYSFRNFLNSKQYGGNWESTQTVAPSNVTATAVSTSSIAVNWTPITYTSDSGGYRVFYSTTPGGPYTYFGMTANKTASSLIVTGLNLNTTYYFVVQTRTYPHGNNQNTVDSEYSAEVSVIPYRLILTSPNGGESWGFGTIRNITWSYSGLSGNIRLELWKADKKLGNIAANIPISSGNYAWFVGNCGPGVASPGNDYKVKIITANGLYNDASNAVFSIIQPSLTLTSPRGNENWKLGIQQNITWTSAGLTGNVKLLLFKGGVQVGVIARGIPISNGSYAWTVGRYSGGMAPVGSNYTVKIRSEDNSFYSSGSGAFTLQ